MSSIGWVIFTLLPLTSTMESSPVIEWPVDKMKNLSAAWSRNAGNPATESSPRREVVDQPAKQLRHDHDVVLQCIDPGDIGACGGLVAGPHP